MSNLETKSETMPARSQPLPLQERVEAQGHLIDSHIMEQILDTVVEFGGRFEVEEFRIGRTNSDGSYVRLKVETDDAESMEKILSQLLGLGCAMVDSGDAELFTVERDRCAPEDFYSTTNHKTYVRHAGHWVEVQNQRMDAMVVVQGGQRWLPAPARYQSGRPGGHRDARHSRGSRIEGARPAGVRLHEQRHFVGAAGGDGRAADRGADGTGARGRAERSSWWPDLWWSTPAARAPLSRLIREG